MSSNFAHCPYRIRPNRTSYLVFIEGIKQLRRINCQKKFFWTIKFYRTCFDIDTCYRFYTPLLIVYHHYLSVFHRLLPFLSFLTVSDLFNSFLTILNHFFDAKLVNRLNKNPRLPLSLFKLYFSSIKEKNSSKSVDQHSQK